MVVDSLREAHCKSTIGRNHATHLRRLIILDDTAQSSLGSTERSIEHMNVGDCFSFRSVTISHTQASRFCADHKTSGSVSLAFRGPHLLIQD